MFSTDEFLSLLDDPQARFDGDRLVFRGRAVPVTNGIPRFTDDMSYSDGNFATLRQRHAALQLDSRNGTTDRADTLLDRTGWDASFFGGKRVLECGCGAGPDTEALLKLGARVVSADIAGVDVAASNIGANTASQFVQASIMDLPFKKASFDIVFCHRVLQHTPDPEKTLDHILQFVKPGGAVFVHSYARTFAQMFRWKYALRPLTRRMNPETLYRIIERAAPAAFAATNILRRIPVLGRAVCHVFVPFLNYRHAHKFAAMDDAAMIEYAVHDTFDALAPPYDRPVSAATMRAIAARYLPPGSFEIDERPMITLLRTTRAAAQPPDYRQDTAAAA